MFNQPGLRALNLQKVRFLDRVANSNPALATELRNLKLNWYTIRNAAEGAESTDVFVYDEIGGSMGVNAQLFCEELNEITTPEIVVRINSPGGMLKDGIAIANAFAQHPSHIITRVDGMAASAASIIAVGGDVCEMMNGSEMMIHDVLVNFAGNASDCREMADWLDRQSENVAEMYARKAGGAASEWRERMLAETWMFANEAVELKLADRVYEGTKGIATPEEVEGGSGGNADPEVTELNAALTTLMNRKHRITNRGFKYMGRDKAPNPAIAAAKAAKQDANVAPYAIPSAINPASFADLLESWR